jgi:hypothetical protein
MTQVGSLLGEVQTERRYWERYRKRGGTGRGTDREEVQGEVQEERRYWERYRKRGGTGRGCMPGTYLCCLATVRSHR